MSTATPGKIATALTLEQKVSQIKQWFLEGQTAGHIQEAIAHHFPGDTAAALLAAAADSFAGSAKFSEAAIFGFIFEATREVFRCAFAAADYATALRALKQLKELSADAPNDEEDDEEEEDG